MPSKCYIHCFKSFISLHVIHYQLVSTVSSNFVLNCCVLVVIVFFFEERFELALVFDGVSGICLFRWVHNILTNLPLFSMTWDVVLRRKK